MRTRRDVSNLFAPSRVERIVFFNAGILSLAFFGTGVWVLVHFIRKYW